MLQRRTVVVLVILAKLLGSEPKTTNGNETNRASARRHFRKQRPRSTSFAILQAWFFGTNYVELVWVDFSRMKRRIKASVGGKLLDSPRPLCSSRPSTPTASSQNSLSQATVYPPLLYMITGTVQTKYGSCQVDRSSSCQVDRSSG